MIESQISKRIPLDDGSKASTNDSVIIPNVILRGRAYNDHTDRSMIHIIYRRNLKCADVDCKTMLASALFDQGGLSPCLQVSKSPVTNT